MEIIKPKISGILKLLCPYCLVTPLRKKGSWFIFRKGCKQCNYRYEREIGYFTGASWMIAYPFVSLSSLGLTAILKGIFFKSIDVILLISFVSFLSISFTVLATPYFKGIWLYFDHKMHPLNPSEDYYDKELLS